MVMDIYDSGSTDRYSSKYRINKITNRKRIIRQIIDETEPAFNCEPDLNIMLNQSDALFELLDYTYLQVSFRLCTRINRDLYLRDIWHKITIYNSNKKVKSKYRIYANSNREEIKNKISSSEKLNDRVREYALEKTEIINDSCAICHYDFHPGNIIISENGPFIVDWANALIGDVRADVSRTSLMLRAHISKNGIKPYSIAEFSEKNDFHSRYLKTYIKNGSIDIEELLEFEVITASVRLAEDIKEENDFLQEIIKNSICERRGKSE